MNLPKHLGNSSITLMIVSCLSLPTLAFASNSKEDIETLCANKIADANPRCAGGFINGGSSFGTIAVLGTNDLFDLQFETNNSTKVTIKTDGKVGIGTTSPTAQLEVAGLVKITGGSPAAGKVLTSDATGLASWTTLPTNNGEANTASNVGTAGVGLFKQKTSTNLEFKNINSLNGVTITDDTANNEIDIGVNPELAGLAVLSTNGIIKRNGAGSYTTVSTISLGTEVTGALPITNGGTGATTATAAINGLLPSQSANSGKVLMTDGTNVTWSTPAPSGVTNVSSANSYIAVTNSSSTPVIAANVGTAANTLAAGNDSRIVNAVQQTAYASDVAAVATCAGNQKPFWNTVTDAWACTAITGFLTSGSAFEQGGNSFGSAAVLGTNDTQNLSFKTSNSSRMTILANGSIGIGTISPSSALEIAGQIKITGGSPGAGKVLTSDASGLATWATPSGGSSSPWSTFGSDIYFSTGNVGIGTNFPTKKLDVEGSDARINGLTVGRGSSNNIYSVAVGNGTLVSASTGTYNTAIGASAGYAITTGEGNVAIGFSALNQNATSNQNTAVGSYALFNTTAQWNVGVGHNAGYSNTTGQQNLALGVQALMNNQTGVGNVAVGGNALYEVTSAPFDGYNTAVGYNTGRGITTGLYNTIIGAQVTGLPTNLTRNIIIADGQGNQRINVNSTGNVGLGVGNATTKLQVAGVISPSADASYNLGDSSLRFTAVYAQNGTINTSDAREKNNIQDSDLGLEFITRLRPVSYRWKKGQDQNIHYGLIAQEVEKLLSQLKGSQSAGAIVSHDESTDRYGIRYAELISPLIKSVQDLNEKDLKNQRTIQDLEKRIQSLEKALAKK